MRVAFVAPETVHHRPTAAAERAADLATHLATRGHEVIVCCPQWWGGHHAAWEQDGITYRRIGASPDERGSFAAGLLPTIARLQPDVVHAVDAPARAILAANSGATVARAPLVAEFYWASSVTRGRIGKLALSAADDVVVPSRMVQTRLRECGAAEDQLLVVPDAIDLGRIRRTDPAEPVEVVYARRLDEGANLESLLLGLAELRDREWSATVIGDGPGRDDYERQARDLRIYDRITFAGECSREERIARYRGAHAFVQTATRCAFATELLWGLACGCVGIVEYHADSSAHELVEGRERGFRTTSEGELAAAIRSAGDLKRRTVDDDFAAFDREAVLERYLACYRDLGAGG